MEDTINLDFNFPLSASILQDFIKSCSLFHMEEDDLHLISQSTIVKLQHIIKNAEEFKKHHGRTKLTSDDFIAGLELCFERPLNSCENELYFKETDKLPRLHLNKTFLPSSTADIQELPEDLLVYFQKITAALFYTEQTCLIAVDDLRKNKNLTPLIPFFLSFISSQISNMSSEFLYLNNILNGVHSLLMNPHIYFSPVNLNQLAFLVMKCLLSSTPCNKKFQHFKDKTASLLVDILKKSKSKQLWIDILFVLELAFSDLSRSFVVHYGALSAVNLIGVSAIMLVVLPHVNKYFKHLEKSDASSVEFLYLSAVEAQLCHSYYLLVSREAASFSNHRSYLCYDILSHLNIDLPSKFTALQCFSTYFGDRLVQHFPFQI